jgi:hypothetical protein
MAQKQFEDYFWSDEIVRLVRFDGKSITNVL